VASVRVPVTVPPTGIDGATHDTVGTLSTSVVSHGGPPSMLPLSNDVPAGRASVIVASTAIDGPALEITRS
jgi:hypothetical protein